MEFNAEGRKLLVIVAHPDDAEFMAGGTVGRWVREGGTAHYLVVTDGAAGGADPAHTAEWIRRTREGEQRSAADVLGVTDVAFLGLRDGEVVPSLELRIAVARRVRTIRPDVAIVPNPVRHWQPLTLRINHPDHLAVGEAALAALYPGVGNAWTYPALLAEGLEPHTVGEIWVANTDSPDYAVDVGETIDLKIEAIKRHVSQVGDSDIGERIQAWTAELGARHGFAHAEEYRRLLIDW